MANTDKMITETVLKDATEKILQTIADKIYDLVPYDSTEISEILEISDEEAMELVKIINDNVISTNKIWSSSKTNTEIQNAIIESNKYADELIGQISSISLEYVTALPTSDIKSNVIYILQGTPNTLNVYNTSTSAFVSVGDLDLDLSQYYTKSDVDTLLADKADDNTVVHQDDVVTDMTTTSGTTVLSTSGLKTELDKKANDDEVVKTTDIATTIDSTSTDSKVPSAKAVYDGAIKNKNMKSYTRVEQLGLSYPCTVQDIWMALPPRSTISVLNELSTDYITDCPANYGILTIEKVSEGRYRILYSQSNGASVNITAGIWQGQLKGTDGSGLIWTPINNFATTTIIDGTTTDCFTLKPGIYSVANGCSKAMNFPYDDNTNYSGTVMVFGSYNIPSENKGYRRMIYMDNKQRMAVASEWWGVFSGGWKHVGKSRVEDVPKTRIDLPNISPEFATGYIEFEVYNGVCYMAMFNLAFVNASTGNLVVNIPGIPKRKNDGWHTISNVTSLKPLVVNIGANGGCIEFYTAREVGTSYYGTFSYLVAES